MLYRPPTQMPIFPQLTKDFNEKTKNVYLKDCEKGV